MTINTKMALNLENVPRWTICPVFKTQNVATHSYNVAMIALGISYRMKMGHLARLSILEQALAHDIDEAVTGDVPSPAKNGGTNPPPFPEDEIGMVVKAADMIENMRWWDLWGNHTANPNIRLYLDRRMDSLRQILPLDIQEAMDQVIKEID